MKSLSDCFWEQGMLYANHSIRNSKLTGYRKFRAFFGVSPYTCEILWISIQNKRQNTEIKHLLWCLFFLKRYNTENVNAAIIGVDEKTFRLWTWYFIEKIAELDVVFFDLSNFSFEPI